MIGPWRETRREAMLDALDAGQAELGRAKKAPIVLREWCLIEERDEPRNE